MEPSSAATRFTIWCLSTSCRRKKASIRRMHHCLLQTPRWVWTLHRLEAKMRQCKSLHRLKAMLLDRRASLNRKTRRCQWIHRLLTKVKAKRISNQAIETTLRMVGVKISVIGLGLRNLIQAAMSTHPSECMKTHHYLLLSVRPLYLQLLQVAPLPLPQAEIRAQSQR